MCPGLIKYTNEQISLRVCGLISRALLLSLYVSVVSVKNNVTYPDDHNPICAGIDS